MANEEEQESIEGLELESSDVSTELEPQEDLEQSQEEPASSQDEQDLEHIPQDDQESDDNTDPIQGTLTKKKKIILIAAAASGLLIITMLLLYLFGFFDAEPIKVQELNPDKTTEMMVNPPKEKYAFKVKDINKKRLNRKLALLTRDEIIELDKPEDEIIVKNDIQAAISQEKSTIVEEIETNNIDENNTSETVTEIEKTIIEQDQKTIPVKISKEAMETSVKDEMLASDTQTKMDTIDESVMLKTDEIDSNKDIEFETVKKDNILVQEIIDNEVNGNTTETNPIEEDNTVQIEALDMDMTEKDTSEEVMSQDDDLADNQEEMMTSTIDQTQVSNSKLEDKKQEEIENPESAQKSFLMFAQVATIKTKLYLSFLQKINKLEKRISVCRNDINHIEIFVGPFTSEEERSSVLNKINNSLVNDAFAIDFTQNEFDKRCKL